MFLLGDKEDSEEEEEEVLRSKTKRTKIRGVPGCWPEHLKICLVTKNSPQASPILDNFGVEMRTASRVGARSDKNSFVLAIIMTLTFTLGGLQTISF